MRNNLPQTVVGKQTVSSGALFLGAKNIFERPKGIFFLSMPGHFQFRRQRELFSGFCHFCGFIENAPKYCELRNITPEISNQNWIFLKNVNASLIFFMSLLFSFSSYSCLINPSINIFPSSSCSCI